MLAHLKNNEEANRGGDMYCRNCGKEVTKESEYCMNCGARPMSGRSFCCNCGTQTSELAEICVKCGAKLDNSSKPVTNSAVPAAGISPKSRTVAALFAFFLGQFGAHRFYSGKIGTAVIILVVALIGYATFLVLVGFAFLAVVGIWNLVDFIMILAGKFKDKEGLPITNW
jgi:TM2 domain-containing membrane protein YozV